MPFLGALAATLMGPPVALAAYATPIDFPAFPGTKEVAIPAIESTFPFNEAIVSWNVARPENAHVKIEARASGDGYLTKWYVLGEWELADATKRTSLRGQDDENGEVRVDTLHLSHPATKLEVRLQLSSLKAETPASQLKLVTVSTSDTGWRPASDMARSTAWGQRVDVPERAQGNYPDGSSLCSPTSVSMLLWHYANRLHRSEMNHDVPIVQAMVKDIDYGWGNWPFNMAYAGSFEGMTAYVTRFRGIQDVERWIDAGIPVVCSLSLDLLMGKESRRPTGHLAIVVGFDENGDPIFNDPAHKDQVRRTYKRSDFERAWLISSRTVYIVHPSGAAVPVELGAPWLMQN